MPRKRLIRQLYRLAYLLEGAASGVRYAESPTALQTSKKRILRSVHLINVLTDRWIDTTPPSNRQEYVCDPHAYCPREGDNPYRKRRYYQ